MSDSNLRVAVLLATYNGDAWVLDQVSSILNQCDVSVTLFISDDFSTDDTYEKLLSIAKRDFRIVILPRIRKAGSAAKNFYRLICDVNFGGFDYVAYSDQDDIWSISKLSSHILLLREKKGEAVSSNVAAFWSDGRKKLIVKSQPQKLYDFLFESAGPGCTFLMTTWLLAKVKHQLLTNPVAMDVEHHDWLTYAVCRAHGKRWIIDSTVSMQYRQHQNNVVGANSGFKAIVTRLKKISSGWYRHEVALISRVVTSINPDRGLLAFQRSIQGNSIVDQFKILPYVFRGRRKLNDRLFLIFTVFFFIF